MQNQVLSETLEKVSKIKSKENRFKGIAYNKAAQVIKNLNRPINELSESEILNIKGIGDSIAKDIFEFLKSGTMPILDGYIETPPVWNELLKIEGVGETKAKEIFETLNVSTIEALKKAIEDNSIYTIKKFKKATVDKIQKGIDYLQKAKGRIILAEAVDLASNVIEHLQTAFKQADIKTYPMFLPEMPIDKNCKPIGNHYFIPTGSIRRRKETCGDIDILVCLEDNEKLQEQASNIFQTLTLVESIIKGGVTPSVMINGVKVELIITTPEAYPSALQHQTGSAQHNILLRGLAKNLNYKMNRYGLWKNLPLEAENLSAEELLKNYKPYREIVKTEIDLYQKLGLTWIYPEIREGGLEIENANLINRTLTKTEIYLKESHIIKDWHIHTLWSDGKNDIEEMILKAIDIGLKEISFADHANTSYNNGLDKERALRYLLKIKELTEKYSNRIIIHSGLECNIGSDGSLDFDKDFLKQFDTIIASIHYRPNKDITDAYLKAVDNGATIIGHITGRKLNERDGFIFDVEKVLKKCKENNVAIEINAQPIRLDAPVEILKLANYYGVKIAVSSDAHSVNNMIYSKTYGLWMLRRADVSLKNLL